LTLSTLMFSLSASFWANASRSAFSVASCAARRFVSAAVTSAGLLPSSLARAAFSLASWSARS